MIKEIEAGSVLRKHKKIDSWFITHYGMNLYRGCWHNCVYCDGRSESYNVKNEFGRDIVVKINAVELLTRELDPIYKRKPLPRSFIMLGGGVCDAYQPIEKKYRLARQALELFHKLQYPVHILTKSNLIERDLDILKKINRQNKVVISLSFSSMDDKISKVFEPRVPVPSERLETLKKIKNAGISCGMFLMPVIPFITDTTDMIDQTLKRGKEAGIDFVIFGTMTLKTGRQKDYFMKVLQKQYPNLVSRYEVIYGKGNRWGESSTDYGRPVHEIFNSIASAYKIPKRIPPDIYRNIIDGNDMIIIILEHLDYLLKIKNRRSPYGYAAYSLSKMNKPISSLSTEELLSIKGIGPVTVKVIQEIIETGKCVYYENLI